jgi:hypothetical protein
LFGVAGDGGEAGLFGGGDGGEEAFFGVEAEVGLALVLVGAVAEETVVGEDRADVAVEVDGGGDGGFSGGGGKIHRGGAEDAEKEKEAG